jgi:hypothetical protein
MTGQNQHQSDDRLIECLENRQVKSLNQGEGRRAFWEAINFPAGRPSAKRRMTPTLSITTEIEQDD